MHANAKLCTSSLVEICVVVINRDAIFAYTIATHVNLAQHLHVLVLVRVLVHMHVIIIIRCHIKLKRHQIDVRHWVNDFLWFIGIYFCDVATRVGTKFCFALRLRLVCVPLIIIMASTVIMNPVCRVKIKRIPLRVSDIDYIFDMTRYGKLPPETVMSNDMFDLFGDFDMLWFSVGDTTSEVCWL